MSTTGASVDVKQSNETFSGLDVTVCFNDDLAVMSGDIASVMHKVESQNRFRDLTVEIEGLFVPTAFYDKAKGVAYLTKAEGTNLTPDSFAQGTTVDFYNIFTGNKVRSFTTYLRMISLLNQQNVAFTDNKSDSVFVEPNSGFLTVIVGELAEARGERAAFEASQAGLVEVLSSFFTRKIENAYKGAEDDIIRTVPEGLAIALQSLKDGTYWTAGNLINAIDEYIAGGDPFHQYSSTNTSHILVELNQIANRLGETEFLATGTENAEEIKLILNSPYARDLLVAEMYRRSALKSGKPQGHDRHNAENRTKKI